MIIFALWQMTSESMMMQCIQLIRIIMCGGRKRGEENFQISLRH